MVARPMFFGGLLMATYTTIERMNRRMGEDAIREYSDHDGDGVADGDVIDDCIEQASAEIDYFCNRYSETGLLASKLIESWATIMACYYAATTRGNPPPTSLEREYLKIMERLEGISSGSTTLPGVSMSFDFRPTMSNRQVNRWHRTDTIRVTKSNSTNVPSQVPRHIQSNFPTEMP